MRIKGVIVSFMPRFLMSMRRGVYEKLRQLSDERGISVQELIRAVIIPDWLSSKRIKLKDERSIRED